MRYAAQIMVLASLLAGCASSTTQSSFNCGISQEEGCLSIEQADKRGLDAGDTDDTDRRGETALAQLRLAGGDARQARTQEVVIELWVGPFVDEANNLHQSSTINVVIWEAEWNLGQTR